MNTRAPVVPRVLVVSGVPFGWENATAITMSNIFAGWPKGRLALIHISGSPATSICEHHFGLGMWRCYPLTAALRKLSRGRAYRVHAEVPGSLGTQRPAPSLLIATQRMLRLANELLPVWMSRPLLRFVEQFRPDVIYTALGSIKLIRLVTALAGRLSVPVVPHYYDDWPSFFYSDGFCRRYPQRALAASLAALHAHVPRGLCIGDEMAQEYTRRFRIPFDPMMNCIADGLFATGESAEPKGIPVATYVGGLHLNRWKSLRALASFLDGAFAVKLYVPPADVVAHAALFAGLPHVELGSLPADGVLEAMKQADVLVHVESFDPDTIAYARLSVSTKIPQYMAAGKPIVAYGPAALASMRVIERSGAGITVATPDAARAAEAIRSLLADAQHRRALARAGLSYARSHYAASVVSARLRRVLSSAALGRVGADQEGVTRSHARPGRAASQYQRATGNVVGR